MQKIGLQKISKGNELKVQGINKHLHNMGGMGVVGRDSESNFYSNEEEELPMESVGEKENQYARQRSINI